MYLLLAGELARLPAFRRSAPFLRLSRQRSTLFVTNLPVKASPEDSRAFCDGARETGWRISACGGTLLLTPGAERLRRLDPPPAEAPEGDGEARAFLRMLCHCAPSGAPGPDEAFCLALLRAVGEARTGLREGDVIPRVRASYAAALRRHAAVRTPLTRALGAELIIALEKKELIP